MRSSTGDPSLTFNVTLSALATKAVTVDYQAVDDVQPLYVPGDATGVPTASGDGQFVLGSGVVEIPKGKIQQGVTITTLPYGTSSIPLWFTVKLYDPSGATLEDAYGTATLLPAATGSGFSVAWMV